MKRRAVVFLSSSFLCISYSLIFSSFSSFSSCSFFLFFFVALSRYTSNDNDDDDGDENDDVARNNSIETIG